MADVPFFRGPNRMDWLFAVVLQTACDWQSSEFVQEVAAVFGSSTFHRFDFPASIFPSATIIGTDEYVFLVLNSTHPDYQWIGNVLGSVAIPLPLGHGSVSAYFGAYAIAVYNATVPTIRADLGSRRLVLIGFSLGGAAATILKDQLSRTDGIESACLVMGAPRAGIDTFNAGYETQDYSGIGVINDPIPSLPPETWSGLGLHNSWLPFAPFVRYGHPVSGFTLNLVSEIVPGYSLQSVSDVVASLTTGAVQSFHNQRLYAGLLRGKDLPDPLPAGFLGYPHLDLFDTAAAGVFTFSPNPWRWGVITPSKLAKGPIMPVQLTIYIRDKGNPPLGPREVYYFSTNSVDGVISNCTSGPNFLSARAGFLAKSCEIYAYKAAFVGSPRASVLKKPPTPIPGTQGVTEKINTSITYFGFSSTRQTKRLFSFRGIDANWITADALTPTGVKAIPLICENPGGALGTTGFLDILGKNGLIVLGLQATIPNGHPITAAAKPTQDANIVLTLADTFSVPAGTVVLISGCRSAPLLNGKWLSSGAAVAGQITLGASGRFSAPAGLTGVMRTVSFGSNPITVFEFNGVSTRKTGRPSFLARGRATPRVRHR